MTAEEIQRGYYSRTAHAYDAQHVESGDEHGVALRYAYAIAGGLDVSSVLDVGCGTGRAVQFFSKHNIAAVGLEPVPAMLEQATRLNGIPAGQLLVGRGDCLPFADGAFDCVCEFGMLHHVPDPAAVVREMTRVARRLVVLSDSNRFGAGSARARILKLLLYRAGLWDLTRLLVTRGKRYTISPGDGLAYSYSVYDSFDLLARWATRMVLVPTMPSPSRSWLHPLLNSPHVLVCAIRESD